MSVDSSIGETSINDTRATSVELAETLKDEAIKLGATARHTGESIARGKAEDAREQIAARSDSVEDAVNDMASALSAHSDTLGHYASEFADTVTSFNNRFKTSSLDELASDTRRVARENPALFMLGAVTIGAIAARFFKASASERHPPNKSEHIAIHDLEASNARTTGQAESSAQQYPSSTGALPVAKVDSSSTQGITTTLGSTTNKGYPV